MYVIPLKVVYKDAEYLDGVDITLEQVYQGLEGRFRMTSLPSAERITQIFDHIRADGFQKGNRNYTVQWFEWQSYMIHLIADQLEDMEDIYHGELKRYRLAADFMPFRQPAILRTDCPLMK